jgi:hypothetical protein
MSGSAGGILNRGSSRLPNSEGEAMGPEFTNGATNSKNQRFSMSGFIGRHQLLSSFVCLAIPSHIADFFILRTDRFGMLPCRDSISCYIKIGLYGYRFDTIKELVTFMIMQGVLLTPVFLISLRLWSYMKRPAPEGSKPLSFAKRFAISAATSFIAVCAPSMVIFCIFPPRLYTSIFLSIVYGLIFGLVFGSQTRMPATPIVDQCAKIGALMWLWHMFLLIFPGLRV